MAAYLLKRLLSIIPVLLGVSFLVFLMVKLAPGDITTLLLGPLASEASKQTLRETLGLNQPIPVQYWKWLKSVLQGDFGMSIATNRDVIDLIVPRLGATLILGGASLVLTVVVGFTAGLLSAARQGTWFDKLTQSFFLVFGNIPPFWLGLVLVLIFSLRLRWFPTSGMINVAGDGGWRDVLIHLVLPSITTAAAPIAVVAGMVRGAMINILSQDYIQVARAKGIPARTILWRHALKNALPPIITIIGLQLGYLLGGTIFSEVVFAWPGLGQLLYSAIIGRDMPVIQASVLAIATTFVVINLLVDLLNQIVDPRSQHA